MRKFHAVSVSGIRVIIGLWILFFFTLSFAEEFLPELDGKTVEISLLSQFPEVLPDRGAITLDFRIRNHQDRSAVWTLHFRSERGWQNEKSLFSKRRIEVDAKSAKTVRWEIPLLSGTEFSGREDYHLSVGVSGPGATGQSFRLISGDGGYGRSNQDALVLVSPALAVNEGDWLYNEIEKQIDDHNEPLELSRFDLEQLPTEVTGFSGVDVMMMSEAEWKRLRASQAVILSWVAGGGHLLFKDGQSASDGRLGLGSVTRLGRSQDPVAVIRRLKGLQTLSDRLSQQSAFRRGRWKLADKIVEIKPSFGLIMLMVIVIAALLGPLNIWVSFRKRNSMQIMWTTPVISLVLSLLVGAGIVISDGFGGKGQRALRIVLVPAHAVEVSYQEQISRTGVLLRNRFELPEGTELYSLPPEKSRERRKLTFTEVSSGTWSGDWFENRAIQAQALRQTRSSRAAVSFNPGPQPMVLSTVDAGFSRILIRDVDSDLWYGENVSPGKPAPLRKVGRDTEKALFDEMKTREDTFFSSAQAGWFYAESQESDRYIESLPSIKWQNWPVWYMGPLKGEAQP